VTSPFQYGSVLWHHVQCQNSLNSQNSTECLRVEELQCKTNPTVRIQLMLQKSHLRQFSSA